MKLMGWLRSLMARILFRSRVEQELDEELRAHVEQRAHDLVNDGLTPDEAKRRARIEFGGGEKYKEECREAMGAGFFDVLFEDLRFGLRMLRRSPGFTAVAVLTLALGIGVNTALFSIVNGVLLSPLPFAQPERLVAVYQKTSQLQRAGDTYLNFLDWQKANESFSALGAYVEHDFNLTGSGEPEKLRGQMVSADFFPMLGVKPLLGRTFRSEEDRLGALGLVLLSESFWKRRFGASASALGQSLTMNGNAYTVIGVVPGVAPIYRPTDVFVLLGPWDDPALRDRRMSAGLNVIGRIKPGIQVPQAQSDMDSIARNLEAAYPEADKGVGIALVSLKETIVGDVRPMLLLLLGAVGFVLLIACANVAGLLLVRSKSRTREFAVRAALGANRARVIRQLLTESCLLAAAGGALGLLLAAWSSKGVLQLLPEILPRADKIRVDSYVLAFSVAVSALTAVLFGVVPALKVSRSNLQESFKGRGRGSSIARYRTQGTFVVIETAIALVLLAGAGLMLRTLAGLLHVNPGFDPHHVLFFNVAPSPARMASSPAQIREAFRELPKQFEAVPGVEAASALFGSLPMQGDSEVAFWLEGAAPPASASEMNFAMLYAVSPDYWKVMRIPLLRGRYLTEEDNENSRPVVLIDEDLARKFFAGKDPIGQRLHVGLLDSAPEIVGIVGHVVHEGLGAVGRERVQAQFYIPTTQIPDKWMSEVALGVDFVARTAGPPESFIGAIGEASHRFDSEQVVYAFDSMDAIVASSIAVHRFSMILLSIFAGLALLLSCVGIYGLIGFLVEESTHEIGIRVALGALGRDVLWLVLRNMGRMMVIGLTVGLAGAFALTRLLSNLVFGVSTTDAATFGGAAALLAAVACAASYIPARRAMRVDPMVALRHE
jgi:predicted permease